MKIPLLERAAALALAAVVTVGLLAGIDQLAANGGAAAPLWACVAAIGPG